MKKIEEIFFVLNARTESVRVPNKMLRNFAGTSLFEIACQKFASSNYIKNFWVSVRDKRLSSIAVKYGANVWWRSPESTQEPNTPSVVLDWHKNAYDTGFRHFLYMNPSCSALTPISTIDSFIEKFCLTESDSLFSVLEKRNFTWAKRKDLFGNEYHKTLNNFYGTKQQKATLETKLVEPLYESANCLYAGLISNIKNEKLFGDFKNLNEPEFYIMNSLEAFDIDEMHQFKLAEYAYKMKQEQLNKYNISIQNENDHKKVLKRIEELFHTEPGSEEESELEILVSLVCAYEEKNLSLF